MGMLSSYYITCLSLNCLHQFFYLLLYKEYIVWIVNWLFFCTVIFPLKNKRIFFPPNGLTVWHLIMSDFYLNKSWLPFIENCYGSETEKRDRYTNGMGVIRYVVHFYFFPWIYWSWRELKGLGWDTIFYIAPEDRLINQSPLFFLN